MNKKTQKHPRRLPLRGWAVLEDTRKQIADEAELGEFSAIPSLVFQALEQTVGVVDKKTFWLEVAQLYQASLEINSPTKSFPILSAKEKESKKMPWEYQGRSWYFWLNLFAKNYGWSESQIGEMDIDTAIGLFQEIEIGDQLDQEFEWGLSEVSYAYSPSTKKSHFQPLPRPSWMLPIMEKSKPVKKIMMPKAMMPVGNVISLDGE